jgi:hypothetical protein
MVMASATEFAKMVPGFDFLQGLMKTAAVGLPAVGKWIAPTLDPAELDKRIEELRTVQFWLEQNAKLLATTIQALEVQRMTLSTLQSMNLPLTELRDALTLPTPQPAKASAPLPPAPAPAREPAPEPAPAPAAIAAARPAAKRARVPSEPAAEKPRPTPVDPMQWWGALTTQFTQLAANALKEGTADAARQFAGAVVKQSVDTAGEGIRRAADIASAPVKAAARAAGLAGGAASAVGESAAGVVAAGAAKAAKAAKVMSGGAAKAAPSRRRAR